MTNPGHTPGKWRVSAKGNSVESVVLDVIEIVAQNTTRTDAELIAQAPTLLAQRDVLLEAAKAMVEWFDDQRKQTFEKTIKKPPTQEEWDSLGQGFDIEPLRAAIQQCREEKTK